MIYVHLIELNFTESDEQGTANDQRSLLPAEGSNDGQINE